MRYSIFGGLRATDGTTVLDLGGRKPRTVLAVLLLNLDRVVSVDRLEIALWGDDPPPKMATSLQTYVSNLRRVLEPNRARRASAEVLVTQDPGYRLVAGPHDLDLARFEALAAEGQSRLAGGEPSAALEMLGEALAISTEEPLPEFAGEEFVYEVTARWTTQRAASLEASFEAGLALGRHSQLLPAIETAATEHPLQERLRIQHALALYRADARSTPYAPSTGPVGS